MDAVSFTITAGETYGLLGPDGAGRTTTISMSAGILARDGGDVSVCGRPHGTSSARGERRIGHVPQDLALYPGLSARENPRFSARPYALGRAEARTRIEEVLEVVGLTHRAKDPESDRPVLVDAALAQGLIIMLGSAPLFGVRWGDPLARPRCRWCSRRPAAGPGCCSGRRCAPSSRRSPSGCCSARGGCAPL
ncbi:ATP-binding cassette domain-containing protein [Nonomuraea fuscirosea]|uniref:ATP-binding cassette domain-containing protein n=1 Tax=Nonomuraea fuscirosea TaxID=1291556 RepID=UPI003437C648